MLRAVFFDAAGTLFDACEPVGRTYTRIARAHGLKASEEQVTDGFRRAFADASVIAFGPGHSASDLRELERRWWREVVGHTFAGLGPFAQIDECFSDLFAHFANPAHWRIDPEAPRALDRLKQHGLALGVISNFDYRLYAILDGLGLSPYFDSITISSEAGYAKPRREIFDAALSRYRLDAREAIHVGDSIKLDFEPARALGFAAVLIDPQMTCAMMAGAREARIRSLAYLAETTRRLAFA